MRGKRTVSSRPDSSNRQIIHVIAPGQDDRPGDMESPVSAKLATAGLDVRDIGDVYRALARIGNAGPNLPLAVVVCADGLTRAEIEFFSIVARVHRGLAVYVYGQSSARERIASAIDMGATGELTDDVIRTLADATSSPPSTVEDDVPSASASPQPEVSEGVAPESLVDQTVEPTNSMQPTADVRELPSDSARFPWRCYEDVPKRKPPSRGAPPSSAEGEDDSPDPAIPIHEPLLTDEELRALIGDDPAAALSDDGAPRVDDEAADEGQTR